MPVYNLLEESNFNIVKLTKEVGFGSLSNHFLQRSRREGADFNLLVIGAAGAGKSTLLANLYNQEILAADRRRNTRHPNTIEFINHESVVEEVGMALRLKVTEVLGYGELSFSSEVSQSQVHKEKIQKIVKNVEEKHRNHFDNENYAHKPKPTHSHDETDASKVHHQLYHAAIVFIQPQRNLAISSSDLALLNALQSRVNVIPVVAKADCYIIEELQRIKANLKQALNDSKILLFPNITDVSDDDWVIREAVDVRSHCPFVTIAAHPDHSNAGVRVRKYPWGLVSIDSPIPKSTHKPTNSSHSLSLGAMSRIFELSDCCGNDLVPMQKMLIRSHFEFLKRHTVEKLYENFRTEIVCHVPAAPVAPMRLNKLRETLKVEQEFIHHHEHLNHHEHHEQLNHHEHHEQLNHHEHHEQLNHHENHEQLNHHEHHEQLNHHEHHEHHEHHHAAEAFDEDENLFQPTTLEPIHEEEEYIVNLTSSIEILNTIESSKKNKKNNKKKQLSKDLLLKKDSTDKLKGSHDDLVSPLPTIQ